MEALDREICTQCFWEDRDYSFNVNGRCDICGGTDWESIKNLNLEEIKILLYGG